MFRWFIVVSLVVIVAGGVASVTVPAPLVKDFAQDLSASLGAAAEMTTMLVILTISVVALLGLLASHGFGFATEWARTADESSSPAPVAHTRSGDSRRRAQN